VLEDIKKQTERNLEEISVAAKAASLEEVRGISKKVQQKVDTEHSLVAKELEVYKAEKMKHMDQEAAAVIKNMSEKVLGEAIDTKQHEALIMQALEQAKKESIFGSS
jgi:hypothetical protein